MPTITIEEAQSRLADVIAKLIPGEPLIIVSDDKPVARLIAEDQPERKARRAGSAKGLLTILSDDDEHLSDFAEYME